MIKVIEELTAIHIDNQDILPNRLLDFHGPFKVSFTDWCLMEGRTRCTIV